MDHWFLSVRTRISILPSSHSPFSLSLWLSVSLSLALSLYEGERGRLHRAWQQCSVECELEMWNKDAQQPWKQGARPDNTTRVSSVDVRAAAEL